MRSARILVLRFSAMGDVALVLPVVRSLVKTYPSVTVTIVTRPKFAALFAGIDGVEVFPADVDGEYRGLSGLWKLQQQLRALAPHRVIDLHDHLRTRILGLLLKISGIPVTVFNKGRGEKKNATGRSRSSYRSKLLHTTERYRLAMASAGYPFELMAGPHFIHVNAAQVIKQPGEIRIGIAPFSAHATKTWPLEQFVALMEHLAGLAGVPVVSIWGGTDPVTGFGPAQNPRNRTIAVPFNELECRPCSVYGKETCARGDFACLHSIRPAQVAAALTEILPPA